MGRDKKEAVTVYQGKKNKGKVHVGFDTSKRIEYLTGMSRRKQERRKFGLDMQAYKDKKVLLAERKERRDAFKERFDSAMKEKEDQFGKVGAKHLITMYNEKWKLNYGMEAEDEKRAKDKKAQHMGIDSDDDTSEEEEEDSDDNDREETVFGDEHTQSMFGDEVVVETSNGLFDDDEDDGEDIPEEIKRKISEKEKARNSMSLMQRIQEKSKKVGLPRLKKKGKHSQHEEKSKRGDFCANRKKVTKGKGEKSKGAAKRSNAKAVGNQKRGR